VKTTYVDWQRNFPELRGESVETNCAAWGNGDGREHLKWWFGCVPRAEGRGPDGRLNNWWHYFRTSATRP
jgi:hypothetical protein